MLFCTSSSAQLSSTTGNYNYFEFQKKPFYFGISLGLNGANYRLDHSKNFIGNDSIRIAESSLGAGFNVHLIANMKIGNNFDFRLLPGYAISERKINFTDIENGNKNVIKIESNLIEIPMQLRFKSMPYKDKRMFVLAGIKYSYDVASNSKARNADNFIKISPHDFQLEVGAGMQFFFPFFIFSPEIKFSKGLSNILIFNDHINESRVLEQFSSQVFTLSFLFEG